jgi:predicted MFS family arabinose efflux permease
MVSLSRIATTTSRPSASFPWGPIAILGFAWFLAVSIELSPEGLLTGIARDLGVSVAAAGTLTTLFALGNALLVLPLTSLALRFARRPVLTLVMAVLGLSTAVVALTPDLAVAGVSRFIGGACYALICTLFPAIVIRIAGPRHARRAITLVFTATTLGTALGAPLASLAGAVTGWRPVFLGAALLVAMAGVLLWFVVPRVREHTPETLGLVQTARLPGVLRVAIAWSLVMLAHFIALTYLDAYLADLGAPRYVTGIALALTGVGGVIGTLLIGRVSRRTLAPALIVAPSLVVLGFIVLAAGGGAVGLILVGTTLWGAGVAATVVVYQQALLVTGARAPETATSIGVLLAQAGFAVGATIGGLTIETIGLRAIPLVAPAFALLALVLALTLLPTVRRSEQART